MAINSDQFFYCVLEDMNDGVLVIGAKGSLAYCNDQAKKMLALDDEPGSIMAKLHENPENDAFSDYILDVIYKKLSI